MPHAVNVAIAIAVVFIVSLTVQAGPFGSADLFNVYIATSLNLSNGNVDGVVGSGGNATLTAVTLGSAVQGSSPGVSVGGTLNLDGGSSSAFWFRRGSGAPFAIPEEKAVRDFVGIVAK